MAFQVLYSNDTKEQRLDSTCRLVQWRIDNYSWTKLQSRSFKIGAWKWDLILNEPDGAIQLVPYGQSLPITASFNMRLVSVADGRKTLRYTQFRDTLINSTKGFNWVHGVSLTNRFIIEVEFLDLKTASSNVGSPPSIWSERFTVNQNAKAMSAFGRLFSESIHTDIIISVSNGSIAAHRAVLAARSPVFDRMFTQDLKEKDLSAINIPDMSIELTQAFLSYLYSNNIEYQDFLTHRFDLLRAADKYDVADLKEACQENIIEDIHSENVLERLQFSFMYHASRLKVCCIEYLVKFGKVLDMKEEFDAFLQSADRELVSEVVNEILSAWKPVAIAGSRQGQGQIPY